MRQSILVKILVAAITFICATLIFLFIGKHLGLAQEMNSQNFMLQGGNFNMTSGNKSSTNFKLSDVVGQTAAGVFASKGYIINSGFLNSAAGEIFSFTLSPSTIDFGNLTPNTPVEKSIKITIKNGDLPGYRVSVSENQPLSTTSGAEIPDTSCHEKSPCGQSKAGLWTNNTTYGFGYRMNGKTTPLDFLSSGYFRSFPATSRNEKSAAIMETQARKVTDQAEMILRINVSQNQPVGQYRNVLTFTAFAGI